MCYFLVSVYPIISLIDRCQFISPYHFIIISLSIQIINHITNRIGLITNNLSRIANCIIKTKHNANHPITH